MLFTIPPTIGVMQAGSALLYLRAADAPELLDNTLGFVLQHY